MNNTVLHSDLIVWYSIDSRDSCGTADNLMQSQDGMVIMSTRGMNNPSLIIESQTRWVGFLTKGSQIRLIVIIMSTWGKDDEILIH